jgi:hypothetical protein
MSNYKVRVTDVDGSFSKRFASLKGAVKCFEDYTGFKVENVIADVFCEPSLKPRPKIEQLFRLRGVGMHGNVVVFDAVSEKAKAAVEAARAAA